MKSNRISITVPVLCILLLLPDLVRLSFGQQAQGTKVEIYNLLAAHRFQQAEQAATAYLAATPNDCSVKVFLGLAYRGEARLEPAFKAFRAAMVQCPQSLAALEGAAETAFLLKNAEALVRRVIQLRPADETGYAMLASLNVREGDCAGAVENYNKAPAHVEGTPSALREYAACLVALGRHADAVRQVSRLVALQDNSTNRIALARAQADAKIPPAPSPHCSLCLPQARQMARRSY